MCNELVSRYNDLLTIYKRQAKYLQEELYKYQKTHPLITNVSQNTADEIHRKNSAIRGQYTRKENKIRNHWNDFYGMLESIVADLYKLPKPVAVLVVSHVRELDADEYDEPWQLVQYAEFAEKVIELSTNVKGELKK